MPGRGTRRSLWPYRPAFRPDDRPVTFRAEGNRKRYLQDPVLDHQVVLGLPAATIGLDLVIRGQTEGILAAIGLLLAWIGGTLMWGLAVLIHQERNPSIAAFDN